MENHWTRYFLICLFLTACGGTNDIQLSAPQPILGDCTMSAKALLATYGNPLIKVESADFDGTNDYMLRGAGLTGLSDGKTGILSFWYRIDGGDGTGRAILQNNQATSTGTRIVHIGTNVINIIGVNSAGSQIMQLNTSAKTASATWLHVLASWDVSTGSLNLYVNDVSDSVTPSSSDDTIDYTYTNWSIGATVTGTSKQNGCLAEFYFAPNQYLDFSITDNRRKFISADGKPVNLGIDGSLPTGTAPIVFFHLDPAEAPADFATNRGTGGSFSITGTLTAGSSSPSD